ncbi:helix-turn-helix domain-containing protein [Ancylobacter pratisalsi]|uniref:Cupin domain-containing protein n=1 Tax=Ancylobacter pratisalsi TaxID=1745854 RepID=A0A6P1YRC0_9HYPH|nr:XRE family transcriptional regulator [Ancylobacter pratisalsi]QIB35575.1 cupin domain-containing protein [Ancylobacter pratisalsi]
MVNSEADKVDQGVAAVGPRVRYLRRLHRLRLKDLAAMAGCSESLLSRIENALVVPSLSTLHRLSKALNVNVAALIDPKEEQICTIYGPNNRPRYTRAAEEGDGSTAEILTPFAEHRQLEGLLLEMPAHGPMCGPFQHAGEEVGYILSGELELHVEGEHYRVQTGYSFFFQSDRIHSYRASGNENCRVIWVNTPPTF